jgi:hypothetical protein
MTDFLIMFIVLVSFYFAGMAAGVFVENQTTKKKDWKYEAKYQQLLFAVEAFIRRMETK